MKCEMMEELMQRYLDRDLLEAEHAALFAHLKQCPGCTAKFERLQRLSDDLEHLPEVMLPASIVDSILPQLERIELAAAAYANIPDREHPAKRTSIFSWKWISGLTAAAVLIGILVLNHNTIGYNEDHLLSGSSKNSMSMADTARGASGSGKDYAAKKDTNEKKESAAKVPAASGATNTDKVTVYIDLNNSSTTLTASGASPSSTASTAASNTAPASAGAPVPTAVGTPAPALTVDPAPTPMPSSGAGVTTPGQPETKLLLKPQTTLAVNNTQELKSPDGVYTGYISNNQVFVKDQAGTILFTSTKVWSAADIIKLDSWIETAKLSYEVKTADGTTKEVVIDVKSALEEVK